MKIFVSDSDLQEMVVNFEYQNVVDILRGQYEKCFLFLRKQEIGGDIRFNCSYEERHLDWLGELIEAFPVDNSPNTISDFLQYYHWVCVDSQLETLEFEPEHRVLVSKALRILNHKEVKKINITELEDLAVDLGVISRCRRCQYGHFTTPAPLHQLRFEGCLENNLIPSPVTGGCIQFSRRMLVED